MRFSVSRILRRLSRPIRVCTRRGRDWPGGGKETGREEGWRRAGRRGGDGPGGGAETGREEGRRRAGRRGGDGPGGGACPRRAYVMSVQSERGWSEMRSYYALHSEMGAHEFTNHDAALTSPPCPRPAGSPPCARRPIRRRWACRCARRRRGARIGRRMVSIRRRT